MDKGKIEVKEEMSESLKNAINYLNDHNVGLEDKIQGPGLSKELEDDNEDEEDLVFEIDEDITADVELPEEDDEAEGAFSDEGEDLGSSDTDISDDEETGVESIDDLF